MQTQWNEWLAAERAAGRSGIVLSQAPIVRSQAYELALPIPGDHTGASFAAALYVGPQLGLAPLAEFTETLSPFDPDAGTTTLTLSLPASSTDTELPPDSDFDGLAEVVFKLDYAPPGGTPADAQRAMSLVIPIVE